MEQESKDILWKEIIEDLFEDFVRFFLPDLYKKIDFSRGYQFLDKELAQIIDKVLQGKKISDRLVNVHLKDGTENWILIHIEVQGYKEKQFSERMFKYFYRIYDKYNKKIVALSIFTEGSKKYKPKRFNYEFHGTKLNYEYNIYKVLEQNEADLLSSDNPFALVVLSGLYALKSENEGEKLRYQFKNKLVRLLLKKEYSREKIYNVFEFLDGILFLSDNLELEFKEKVNQLIGGADKMGISKEMTNIYQVGEKKGIEEGIEKGIEKEKKEMVKRMLKSDINLEKIMEISQLEKEAIKTIEQELEYEMD